jgi:putative nucleotidyltransferase with HDIG domain
MTWLLGNDSPRRPTRTTDGLVALADELDARDPGAARHSRTVGRYARVIARELGFEREGCDAVHLAGLLHDIGKLAIDDAILNKPGALDDSEWSVIREHPRVGAEILVAAGRPEVATWVRAHHEQPDGRGYPDGLPGDSIPLQARILAVADSYEAMTNDRVYRPALGHEEARLELHRCCGTQFDSDVVAAFVACGIATRVGRGRPWAGGRATRTRVRWS